MKPIVMFVAGAVLAAGLVLMLTRSKDAPAPVETAQTAPAPVAEPIAPITEDREVRNRIVAPEQMNPGNKETRRWKQGPAGCFAPWSSASR